MLRWNRLIREAKNGLVTNLIRRIPAWSKILLQTILLGSASDKVLMAKSLLEPDVNLH